MITSINDELSHIDVAHIAATARKDADFEDAVREAIALSATNASNVQLDLGGGKTASIDYPKLRQSVILSA